MTSDEFRIARGNLGLTTRGMASILRFGANGDRRVRRIENGEIEISGPVEVAIEALIDGWWPEGFDDAGFAQ